MLYIHAFTVKREVFKNVLNVTREVTSPQSGGVEFWSINISCAERGQYRIFPKYSYDCNHQRKVWKVNATIHVEEKNEKKNQIIKKHTNLCNFLELQGSKDKQHPQKTENPLGLVSSPNAESE